MAGKEGLLIGGRDGAELGGMQWGRKWKPWRGSEKYQGMGITGKR